VSAWANVADGLDVTFLLKERVNIGDNVLEKSCINTRSSIDVKEALDRVGSVTTHADAHLNLLGLLADGTKEELLAELCEQVTNTLIFSNLLVADARAPLLPHRLILRSKRTDAAAIDVVNVFLRIRTDSRNRNLLHRSILGPENDTSIDGTDTALADKERVDINLLDKRMISSKITKGDKKRLKLLHIDRTLTTDTLKSLEDLSALHAGTSNRTSEGRKDESTILVNLHKFATSAEHDNRTKLRIAVGTEKNLKPFSISSIG